MTTSADYMQYLGEQIAKLASGKVHYRKMFGDYMLYINAKPLVLVCDNQAFIKQTDLTAELMHQQATATPYPGAKVHYILDIDDLELIKNVLQKLEATTAVKIKKTKANLGK